MPLSHKRDAERKKLARLDVQPKPDAPQLKSTPFQIESNTNPTVDASGEVVPEYW